MSGKTKVFKPRPRRIVAQKRNDPTKPKAFTKESGRHLQDFSGHSVSECHEKGPADQSFSESSGQLGKVDFAHLACCVAFLNSYAKGQGSRILHALLSKLTTEFRTKIQQVENLENSLHQSEKEKTEVEDNLIKVSSALTQSQQETEHLKIELDKFGRRIVNKETLEKVKYRDERKAYENDTLSNEFYQGEETSQTQTQILGLREMRLTLQGNVRSNQNLYENTLLEYKLNHTLDELERMEVILKEAKQGHEFEHALRKTLDQTVKKDRTTIELLQERCIELSLSNENYLEALLQTEAALEETRDEKDYIMRQKQAAEETAKDYFNQKKSSDEENQILLNLHKQEIEYRDKKLEELTRMKNSTIKDLIKENQLNMMSLMEKEKHGILIDKQKAEAKLDEFKANYETERRKNRKLQRQVSEYKNKVKLLKNENVKEMKSDEDKIRRIEKLQKQVKEKDQAIQTLAKSLQKFKSDNTVFRHEISDKASKLQQSLAMLKELKEKLQKTIIERENEYGKRKALEGKLTEIESNASSNINNLRKELESAEDQLSKEKNVNKIAESKLAETKKMLEYVRSSTIDRQDSEFERCIENVEKTNTEKLLEQKSLHAKLQRLEDDPIKDRQELKTTKDQFLKLQHEHQFVVTKLNETEDKLAEANNKNLTGHRFRQDLKTKCFELEHCIKDLREANQYLESKLELKNNSIQELEVSFESFKKECLENSQQRERDFQNNVEQLSKLRHREKTILEELNKASEERDKYRSETESEKRKVEELQKQFDYTNEKLQRLEEGQVKGEMDKLRRELNTTQDGFLELKHDHLFVVTKLKETEDMLVKANNENQKEHCTRQELKTRLVELENCIKDLRNANQQLENEVERKNDNIQALKVSLESLKHECLENSQQLQRDFQNNVEQLSKLRHREKTILEELNKANVERDKYRSETETEKRKVKELQKQFDYTNEKLQRLEEGQVKGETDKLRQELNTTQDGFLELQHEHQFVVAKLKETEYMLGKANNANQVENRTSQELKTRLFELENCMKDLRNANQHLENEVKLKNNNIQALEVSFEVLKQECLENSQQRERDFQNNVEQLSELRHREKTVLEELKKARIERDENKSETEIEKHKVTELQKRVNGYEHQIKQSKHENDEIFRVQNHKLTQLEKEVKKRYREIEDLTKSLKQIKHQNDEQRKQIHTLMETKEHFKQQLQIAENQLQEITDREHDVTEELKRKNKEHDDITKYLEETNKQLISQKHKILHLEKEGLYKDKNIKVLQKSPEDAHREINEKHQLMQDLRETKENLSSAKNQQKLVLANLKKAEAELNAVKAVNGELQSKVNAVSELGDQLQKALSKLEKTEVELEETKTRLSKAMGDRLTDNNPNIADLSDKNRPVKLAERYSELYDNQWTDAYDVLEKRFGREQHTIESLLEILQDAFRFCEVNAVKQLEDLQRGLLFTKTVTGNFPTGVLKLLKDCRKRMSSAAIKDLYEMYMSHLKMSQPEIFKNVKDISEFVKECLELCWLMAIQDPPVVLAPVAQPGSDFNTDIYKAYTSSGKQVDYTVWPPMLLHKGGPILSKGIAQGYGKKTSKSGVAKQ